jgi:hypothetical protein
LLHIFSLLLLVKAARISLEPCAFNADFQQILIPRFNRIFLLYGYPLKEGFEGERRPKDKSDFTNTF